MLISAEGSQIRDIVKISVCHTKSVSLTVISTASSAEFSFPFLIKFQTSPALISGRAGPAAICIDAECAHMLQQDDPSDDFCSPEPLDVCIRSF